MFSRSLWGVWGTSSNLLTISDFKKTLLLFSYLLFRYFKIYNVFTFFALLFFVVDSGCHHDTGQIWKKLVSIMLSSGGKGLTPRTRANFWIEYIRIKQFLVLTIVQTFSNLCKTVFSDHRKENEQAESKKVAWEDKSREQRKDRYKRFWE